jgi:hypothetical protein
MEHVRSPAAAVGVPVKTVVPAPALMVSDGAAAVTAAPSLSAVTARRE